MKWSEDVRLPDGRTVKLKRWAEFKGGSGHPGEPATESLQRLEFKHPDTGETVRWENATEDGRLFTLALWLDNGTPQLLTEPAYGGDLRRFNCPNPPYLLYEYAGGRWLNKPLARVSLKRVRSNLTASPLNSRQLITQSHNYLNVGQTSNSHTFLEGRREVPYVLSFEEMPAQTFKLEDCSRVSNLKFLISVEATQ